ncbi:hypothetical protein [Candidatus Enterococcus clewellii]|uniref:Uncharacterized protein n=1 Tax=Candidatus Enterococcus clewellii TaxID=1834193 RepID=A0A242K8F6_9ENTE|nr:hypothetical protein [Enterococcus sp. 9E7_DIV0242]OTP15977.1 hypothetical protein A5888_002191 [Enterococcus sp. 9E7_DIV0242]
MVIEFEGYQLELLVYGKKCSKEQLARWIHHLTVQYPKLTTKKLVDRFIFMYDYQQLPVSHSNQEADLLVDMDTYMVFDQGRV